MRGGRGNLNVLVRGGRGNLNILVRGGRDNLNILVRGGWGNLNVLVNELHIRLYLCIHWCCCPSNCCNRGSMSSTNRGNMLSTNWSNMLPSNRSTSGVPSTYQPQGGGVEWGCNFLVKWCISFDQSLWMC